MPEFDYVKLAHEVKDAKDIADIGHYIYALESLIQQGRWYDVDQLIGEILEKYKDEANQYNKGRTPAQTPQDAASACYQFLNKLRGEKMAKRSQKSSQKKLQNIREETDMSTNLPKPKRDDLLSKISAIRAYIACCALESVLKLRYCV